MTTYLGGERLGELSEVFICMTFFFLFPSENCATRNWIQFYNKAEVTGITLRNLWKYKEYYIRRRYKAGWVVCMKFTMILLL